MDEIDKAFNETFHLLSKSFIQTIKDKYYWFIVVLHLLIFGFTFFVVTNQYKLNTRDQIIGDLVFCFIILQFGYMMRLLGYARGKTEFYPILNKVIAKNKEIGKKYESEILLLQESINNTEKLDHLLSERDQEVNKIKEEISKLNNEISKIEVENYSSRFFKSKDSDHYAWPDPKDRKKIVEEYRSGKASGEIKNKESWAQSNYHIGAKTLKAYEDEFPIGNVTIPKNS